MKNTARKIALMVAMALALSVALATAPQHVNHLGSASQLVGGFVDNAYAINPGDDYLGHNFLDDVVWDGASWYVAPAIQQAENPAKDEGELEVIEVIHNPDLTTTFVMRFRKSGRIVRITVPTSGTLNVLLSYHGPNQGGEADPVVADPEPEAGPPADATPDNRFDWENNPPDADNFYVENGYSDGAIFASPLLALLGIGGTRKRTGRDRRQNRLSSVSHNKHRSRL